MSFDREAFVRSTGGTLFVALVLCLVCAAVVSLAAVGLRPKIQDNKVLKIQRNVLQAAGLYEEGMPASEINRIFEESIEQQLVNLPRRPDESAEPGTLATDLPQDFDPRKAAKDPRLSVEIPAADDLAKLRRREIAAPVYLLKDPQGHIRQYIFPVYGKGLWSTMYGFVSLDDDLRTINAITFYEHGETPGLGGEIDNERWKIQWKGKVAIDDLGTPQIDIVKGIVNEGIPGSDYKIEGLTGATITSNGVEGLINYWLGPDAFGPYIRQQRQQNQPSN